jgi:phosphoglycolate phosphatase-like HAD superfamily hydrolase
VSVWAFDVDGTIVGSIRSDVLRPGAAELVRTLGRRGVQCVLWSAGGADHARRMASRHGIDHHVVAYYGKERRDGDGRYELDHFAPAHRPDVLVDDAPTDLPASATVIAVPPFLGNNPADAALLVLLERLDDHDVPSRP